MRQAIRDLSNDLSDTSQKRCGVLSLLGKEILSEKAKNFGEDSLSRDEPTRDDIIRS
jgi:hypothetical protein